jgi:hypothetical protein
LWGEAVQESIWDGMMPFRRDWLLCWYGFCAPCHHFTHFSSSISAPLVCEVWDSLASRDDLVQAKRKGPCVSQSNFWYMHASKHKLASYHHITDRWINKQNNQTWLPAQTQPGWFDPAPLDNPGSHVTPDHARSESYPHSTGTPMKKEIILD